VCNTSQLVRGLAFIAAALLAVGAGAAGCNCSGRAAGAPQAEKQAGRASTKAPREVSRGAARAPLREREVAAPAERVKPPQRCFEGDTPLSPPRSHDALVDRAGARFEAGDYETALVCAEEASQENPDSVEAHHGRALALAQLGQLNEARDAITRALALDPDDPETLAAAADLYVNRLGPSTQLTEIGLTYAERASRILRRGQAPRLAARVALIEGQALNDLGRASEALPRIDAALQLRPDDLETRYERAVAYFEVCKFGEARAGLEWVLKRDPDHAYAHHYLGLTLERTDEAAARLHFARARALRPRDFLPPVAVTPPEFQKLVDEVQAQLPADARAALARVPLEVADLPVLADLTAEEPPLSPTVLGLFRGIPNGATCKPPDGGTIPPQTIVLYRRNLARAVVDRAELKGEIRKTLLHEIGHLNGEDDASLRARGLE
jgi:tetratricopeptide (TPR) repeat protein